MSVEEDKRLILKRLDELRESRMNPLLRRAEPIAVERPAPPQRRRRSWFDRSAKYEPRPVSNNVEVRLERLEERLIAMERCFVQANLPAKGRRRPTSPTRDSPPLPVGDVARKSSGGSVEPAAKIEPWEDSEFDFGGKPYRLTGSMQDGLITDVLQLISTNRKTGRFSLFLPKRDQRFDVMFHEGEIVHSIAGDQEGESAFFTLMTLAHQEGYFGFLPEENPDYPKSIEAKTQFLVLEALRRIDEESQGKTNEEG